MNRKRPPFKKVLAHWQQLVELRGMPSALRWVFRENLCLEKTGQGQEERKVLYRLDPAGVNEEDVRRVYLRLVQEQGPLVFAVLDQSATYTLCTLFSDELHLKDDIHQPEWDIYFHLKKKPFTFTPVSDPVRWRAAKLRESRSLNDFDYVPVLSYVKKERSPVGGITLRLKSDLLREGGGIIPAILALVYLAAGYMLRTWDGVLYAAGWLALAFGMLWLGRRLKDRGRPALGFTIETLGWGWLLLTGFFLTLMRPA